MQNIYLSDILSLSIKNKYSTWYQNIILYACKRASSRKQASGLLGYVEGHHILPKFLCTADNQKNDQNNIAFLTAREHFLVHWLLAKMIDVKKSNAYYALARMRFDVHSKRNLTSAQYAKSKEYLAKAKSISVPWNLGKSYTTMPCSESRAKNIAAARKNTKKIHCEYCRKNFDPGNYAKSHGPNCRRNPTIDQKILDQRKESNRKGLSTAKQKGNIKTIPEKWHHTNLECPWCNKKGQNYGNMMRLHFDRCNQNPLSPWYNKKRPSFAYKVSCIVCKRETDIGNLFKLHGSRCSKQQVPQPLLLTCEEA